jgi:hypothetical protein
MPSSSGGVAHMVERSLRMREARGSIPRTSIPFFPTSPHGTRSHLPVTVTVRADSMNLVRLAWRRRLLSSPPLQPAHGHGCCSGSVRSPLPPPPPFAPHPCHTATHARLFATAAPPPGRLTARRGGDDRGGPGGAQGRGVHVQAALLRGARLRRRALPRNRIGRRQDTPRDRVPVSFIFNLLHAIVRTAFVIFSFLINPFSPARCFMAASESERYRKGLCRAAFLLTRYDHAGLSHYVCP